MKSTCRQNAFYALFLFVVLICAVECDSSAKHKTVDTNDGKVRGVRQTTLIKNLDYYSFKGIPYAKSPTGELRFKAPEPIESWSPTVLNATDHGPICYQQNDQSQSEDCLFLNIYAPADTESNETLAVMVHIHGGGYNNGSGNEGIRRPDFLIEQRVILVTLNYRLGVFGFMSFGTPEYSGNMGLKDQQLAMKWIHSNIHHFSGDNKRITLSGVSAGGSSTHFHMYSSESRKYFRNAILMSGVADNYWALYKGSDHLDHAHKIAEDLGEPKQTLDELIAFFKSAPANKIGVFIDNSVRRILDFPMNPVIERRDAIRPFIVDDLTKLHEKSVRVDAMFTLVESEFNTYYKKGDADLEGFDRNFSLPLPFREADLSFESEMYQRLAKEIRKFYFKDAAIDEITLKQYIDLLSDANFAYGIDKAARRHAAKTNSKSYYMRFSVDSKLSVMEKLLGGDGMAGAGHLDDICYLFRCVMFQGIYDYILQNPNDEESKISLKTIEYMSKLFANFAKYGEPVHNGDPIAEFLPVQNDQVHFVDVTKDGLKPGLNPNQEANELWARIELLLQTEI